MMGKSKRMRKLTAFVLTLAVVFTGLFPFGVTNVSAAEDDLILYYDFNLQNSYSTVITDASGHQNAGELKSNSGGKVEGTYTIDDVNIYGNTVKALNLPGGATGPYLQMPDGILADLDAVTISMWVNLSTDNGYQRIWDFGNDTTSYMYLLSDGYNENFKGYAAAITTTGYEGEKGIEKVTNIDKNRWVLTTVVMDGSAMSLYENGELIGTKDTGITVKDLGATTGNYIGKGQFADNPTTGKFAEVKIYNKALSAEEIAAMYDVDDAGIVSADKSELDLGDTSAWTEDVTLPTQGANGSAITWTSDNAAVVIADGVAKVTRPAAGEGNATGKLTANITYNAESDVKEFDVTVLAAYTDMQNAQMDAENAAEQVGDLSAVMSDITLPLQGANGSAITWESTNPAVVITDGTAAVTRPAIGAENATGKLKATVKYGTATVEKEFDITVIALREAVTIAAVEDVHVTTLIGHSPSLPNHVKVTYTDGSVNKCKAVWPAFIEETKYTAAGSFDIEGSIVGETRKITANVTVVDEDTVAKTVVSENFDLSDITLDTIGENGSILTQNRDRDIAYLKLLDTDRMLYNFYKTFGLTEKIENVAPLGGWDEPAGLLRGHSTGHYMSALALAYASTGDTEIKENLDYVVHEMREMQKLSKGNPEDFETAGVKVSTWSTDPNEWGEGFLSGYSPDQFALLEQYTPYGGADSGIWAPYYTLHKLMAGFLDAYTYTGNEEALETAKALGTWVCRRLGACTQEELTAMWDMYIAGEFGGFNESLAQLYIYTGDETYLEGAKLFDNTNFFNKLKVNVDDIRGRHANQHIPQIIGALEIYEATVEKGTPEAEYYDIAENFWQMTVSRYAYSIGGVGTGEKFTQPYEQANNIAGTTNCETCAAYNMLKLTKMLNNYRPDDAEYMDYYERTLYNQILASQTPNVNANMHNGTTYMLPIGPGSVRSFGGDYDSFTCCHGTGMENHVKYQEAAYAKTADSLYVGLYLPSTVTWEEKGVKVVQETNYPSEDTKLTVLALDGMQAQSFDMKLRVPYWATNGFIVKVNGTEVMTNPEISTYVTIEDVKADDVIEITMPWTLHVDKTPDKLGTSEVGSVMYGPFVMAAQSAATEWKTLVLSADLSDSIQISENETTGFPTLTANGYSFAPMFSPEYATQAYHAYFKVLTADDDGSRWYEAKITNNTPKFGAFTIDADMVKEGGSLVITAAPKDGYMVKVLTINGEEVAIGEDNTYTVENVSSDLVIEGSFRLINPPTPDPAHLEFTATASSDYTSAWENVDRINTDWEPTASNPGGTGMGWGNWSQAAGSEHYVQYDWDTKVTINKFNVFWYDDGGGTRIPASIKVLYQDAEGVWQEADMLSAYEDVIATDTYNTIQLKTFATTAVRLVMTVHAEGAANGILRWKVSYEKTEEDVAREDAQEALTTKVTEIKTFAEGLKEADYTAESWENLQKAIQAAEAVLEDVNVTAEDVAKLQSDLETAKSKLEKKSSGSTDTDGSGNKTPGAGDNTSGDVTQGGNNSEGGTQGGNTSGNGTQGSETPGNETAGTLKKGDVITVKGVKYRVTNVQKKEAEAYAPEKKSAKKITISNTVKVKGVSCKVVSIKANAFAKMKKLTSVTIPKNVSKIGKKAFYNSKKLKNVKISSKSLKSVGKYAFKGIAKKAKIDVPNKQLKKYKKLLKKAKTPGSVKIK